MKRLRMYKTNGEYVCCKDAELPTWSDAIDLVRKYLGDVSGRVSVSISDDYNHPDYSGQCVLRANTSGGSEYIILGYERPQIESPANQDHTLESIRIDIQAACQVSCIVRDKMPHDAYRDELSRIATALAELCNDVSRLEMAEIPAKAFVVPRGWESVES